MNRLVPDLVLLGNLLVDDIVLAGGHTRIGEPGGAMLYAALAAGACGLRVGLVSVRGSDYPEDALDALRSRGVDLAGVRPLGKPGVRTWLLYEPSGRRVLHHLGRPSHEEVSPALSDIPPRWYQARAFHLSPMPIERQRELAEGLARQAGHDARTAPGRQFVSLDPHEPVRQDNLSVWSEVLAHVDAFFPSHDEVSLADDAPLDLARALGAKGRLRLVAFKRGVEGGVLVDLADSSVRPWSASASRVVDPTGAGDAFAGGFLAAWLEQRKAEDAVTQGSRMAALAVTDWGARALR